MIFRILRNVDEASTWREMRMALKLETRERRVKDTRRKRRKRERERAVMMAQL